jgi:hypothetical protein
LIQNQIEKAEFYERTQRGIGKELCPREDSVASSLLSFPFNNSNLFDVIQSITQCERIGSFSGRVYRLLSCSGLVDSWHDDRTEHRIVSASVKLSIEVDSGRVLQ